MATAPMEATERKVSIGRVFSRAFGTMGDNAPVVFGLSFLFGALPWVLTRFLGMGFYNRTTIEELAAGDELATTAFVGSVVVAVIVGLAVWMMTQAVLVQPTIAFTEGRRASIGESVVAGLVAIVSLVILGLVMTIGVTIGFLFLVVPGIMLVVIWSVATPACVAERIGPIAALSRSRALTKGSRWRVFGMWLVLFVLNSLASGVLGVVGVLIYGGAAEYAAAAQQALPVGLTVVSAAVQTVTAAVWGTMLASLYVELRDWRDGPQAERLADIFG